MAIAGAQSTVQTPRPVRVKGSPRLASLYRGAKRNAQRKPYHDWLRSERRARWRKLGLAK